MGTTVNSTAETYFKLIRLARGGNAAAVGRLLDQYRSYLRLMAQTQIDHALAVRVDASDVVQETFLEAVRDLRRFQGETEAEVLAWLRKMLCRNIVDQIRKHGAQRRDWHRDASLESMVEQSSVAIHEALGRKIETPSENVMQQERANRLAQALDKLKPEYREIIVLRNVMGFTFPEVGKRMKRSEGASRMLWARALESLRFALATLDTDGN